MTIGKRPFCMPEMRLPGTFHRRMEVDRIAFFGIAARS